MLPTIIRADPLPQDIAPCVIHPIAEMHCSGSEVTDAVLQRVGSKLAGEQLRLLYIQGTALQNILKNSFPTGFFEHILIENNQQLKTIDPSAFRPTVDLRTLVINNNTALNDPNVFNLTRNLNPRETVMILNTAIKEVPVDAFRQANDANNHLQNIYLSMYTFLIIISHYKCSTIN